MRAADYATQQLVLIASGAGQKVYDTDGNFIGMTAPDMSVRLKALNSLLDRAGLRGGVDISVSVAPYEELIANIASAVGIPVGEISAGDPNVIDVEAVVDEEYVE